MTDIACSCGRRGGEHLREHRLRAGGSRRVVAVCCNAPLYLEFKGGHWRSLYAARFAAPPPMQMRTMLIRCRARDGSR